MSCSAQFAVRRKFDYRDIGLMLQTQAQEEEEGDDRAQLGCPAEVVAWMMSLTEDLTPDLRTLASEDFDSHQVYTEEIPEATQVFTLL
jgi:hypothetical protein